MEYFEPSYQQHPHYHHEPMSSHYADVHPGYAMPQHSAPMIAMPNPAKTNETKPRLGKDEVDILEREFKKNPKPTTQTKRQFAEDMGVDLARINVSLCAPHAGIHPLLTHERIGSRTVAQNGSKRKSRRHTRLVKHKRLWDTRNHPPPISTTAMDTMVTTIWCQPNSQDPFP